VNSAPGKLLASFVLPAGAVLLGFALFLYLSAEPLSPAAVRFYEYAAFGGAALLAWRFQAGRLMVAVLLLALAAKGLPLLAAGQGITAGPGRTAYELIAFLLPLNFIALSFTRDRGLSDARFGLWLASLFVQAVGVTIVCRADGAHFPALESVFAAGLLPLTRVPQPALLIFLMAFWILGARFALRRRSVESGLFWSLGAAFLALHAGGLGSVATAYFATGALVLVVSLVEASYFMAYHDELTGLHARRSFDQALLALDDCYAIAVVDVDHFKKFNDVFGHDTGDQVLRMVAARLARVSGGGKSFRYGGEEFVVLFPGKTAKQVYPHVERLRQTIEAATFSVRGPQRVQRSKDDRRPRVEERRGSRENRYAPQDDRRTNNNDRRSSQNDRRIGREDSRSVKEERRAYQEDRRRINEQRRRHSVVREVFVTVSIGVAEPSRRLDTCDLVLRAADKALYRAKEGGRNRVEIYRPRTTPHPQQIHDETESVTSSPGIR
jgi:diguanylate cyclase (GGDEF)-like protein